MVMKEKDNEDLELFLEMRRLEKQKEIQNSLLNSSDCLDTAIGTESGRERSAVSKIVSVTQSFRKTAADRFLDSENDKSDFDWLLTPPRTPSLEMELQKTSAARPTALKSRLPNAQDEPATKSNAAPKHTTLPSVVSIKRPSSSGSSKSSGRSATPTGRPTLRTATKPRSSTPTSRSSMPSSKAADPRLRSLTPTRATVQSSKPAALSSVPASKILRSATPTRQSLNASSAAVVVPPKRSSSVTRSVPATSKNPVPSRGTSPTVRSRTWKPNEMPGFSHDAPPNLKTSLPERPSSTSRSRPRVASGHSSSSETTKGGPNARPRQKSCSPAKVRILNGNAHGSRISAISKIREQTSNKDEVNPVLMGTKQVERVVNMRKLAPPKQDDSLNQTNSAAITGFGRTLSKTSLDMAMRHMDINRSISGNIRPVKSIIHTSPAFSVRSSGSVTSSDIGYSDSPLATSSNSSSELSVNYTFSRDGIEMEDKDFGSGGVSSFVR